MVVLALVVALSLGVGAIVYGIARFRGPRRAGETSAQVAEMIAEMPVARDMLEEETMPVAAATGLGMGIVAAVVVVTGVLVGVLAFLIRREASFLSFDRAIERWASEAATSWSNAVLGGLTHLGATIVVIAIGLVVATWVLLRHRTPTAFAFLTLVIAGQAVTTNLIKAGVARARPELAPRAGFSGESFPSGHAATAAACFLGFALVLAIGRAPRTRALLMAAGVTIGVAVAATRVTLGVHWASDALAGLAIGWAWYLVCAEAFGGRLLRYGAPLEAAVAHIERQPSPAERIGGRS